VSALGFGLVSVVPSQGAALSPATNYVTDIAFSAASVPVAGNAGDAVQTTVYFKTSTTAQVSIQPRVALISSPSTSSMTGVAEATAIDKGKFGFTTDDLDNSTNIMASAGDDLITAAGSGVALTVATTDVDAAGYQVNRKSDLTKLTYETTYFSAWYDVAGTYKWVFWNDVDDSGTISGSEYSEVHTVVVANGTAAITATISPFNATSGASSTNGSLVKISLKDAAGNPANVDSAGGVKVTVSGSAIITTASANAATYIIPRASFNGSGDAWINVTNTVAEIVSVSVSGVGSTDVTGTAKSLTFVTATNTTSGQVGLGSAAPYFTAPASNASTFAIGKTLTLETNATASATTVRDDIDVTDTYGIITGKAGASYSLAVAACAAAADYCGTFTIATAGSVEDQTFTVTLNGGTAVTFTSAASSATGGTLRVLLPGDTTYSAAATTVMAKLSSITVTLRARDQFLVGRPSVSLTASLSSTSRNFGQSLASVYSGSAGTVSWTFTDANTAAGTSLTDVITFSDGTNSATLTISYSDADLGISTMVIDSNDTDSTGTKLAVVTPVAINTGDGVDGTTSAVTVTIKNSAGTLLNGIPVVWSVSGSGAALQLPTGMTSFTSAGVATANVYGWITGTYTVTATAGGKSVSAPVTFASTTGTNARIISATVSGNRVTAKAVDRLGNPVKNVAIDAKTSAGYFGSGVTSTQGTTGADGTVDFILIGGGAASVTISVDGAVYTQTLAVKDSQTNDPEDTYTATTAATATAAASSIGGSFAPAGVNSVTVSVTAVDAATDAATAASDAALEAIDAANAATDAANLAAEAADAATVAAEEARDAADAATAAVEALASEVATLIAGLKAQITTLANTVAKIAKKVKA